jgi:hypothetical protein
MNRTNQVWALMKFQAQGNPAVFVWPLAFGLPLIFIVGGIYHDKYAPSLDLLLSNFNLFFIVIMGPIIVLPDYFRFGNLTAAQTGTEFLLTRAVDRRLVFRARALIFLGLTLVVPVALLLAALPRPDLEFMELSKPAHAMLLAQMPGSTSQGTGDDAFLQPILIPNGNLFVRSWHVGTYLLALLFTQGFLFLAEPLPRRLRNIVVWGVILSIGMAPIFMPFTSLLSTMHDRVSEIEVLFVWYSTHLALFWIAAVALTIALQVWCERRFVRMEF